MQPGPGHLVVGVDGCPAGWFVWRTAGTELEHRIYPSLRALWDANASVKLILVDIPIGLPMEPRACDLEAKQVLGAGRSRVFLTPGRQIVQTPTYPQANALSKSLTGRGISKQLWMIAPKIREADALLADVPGARSVVRECHPEVCFWGLNGAAVNANKKTPEGFEERVNLLERFHPGSWDAIKNAMTLYKRKDAAPDDIVDAMVACVTAWASISAPSKLRTLPAKPPTDDRGLKVEMVYRVP